MSPRLSLILAPALFCCALLFQTAHGRSLTPLPGKTGAPGHGSCMECHTGSGSGSADISFSGGTEYTVGQMYTMMVTVADSSRIRWGFSMVARDTDNNTDDVGTWSLVPGSTDTQVHGPAFAPQSQVSHFNAPITPGTNTYTFEVNWTAPATGVGDVTFYVAANAANLDGARDPGPNGFDNVYLKTLTISEPVVAMNAAPSVTVPAGTVNATTNTGKSIAGISVSDVDAALGDLTVSLSVQNGVLNLADTVPGGVVAGSITANGSASVTIEGTLAEINATLGDANGVVYLSDSNYLGSDTLNVLADDNGNTGGGGALTGDADISILVSPPPSLTDLQFLKNGDFAFTLNGVNGLTYLVERTNDLDEWFTHDQVTLAGPTALITDDGISGVPKRYYRASEIQP